jgi:hypothetical protein
MAVAPSCSESRIATTAITSGTTVTALVPLPTARLSRPLTYCHTHPVLDHRNAVPAAFAEGDVFISA